MGVAGNVFVGRDHELGLLRDLLADAIAGRGRVALVSGDPGIGKTRLIERLTAEAAAGDALIAWASCWDDAGAPAYFPWLQLLRELSENAPAVFTPIGETLRAVATESTLAVEGSQHDRFLLFESATGALRKTAAARPLVLVIDDLHNAEESSVQLLRFVSHEVTAMRVLLVGTYRVTEVGPEHALTDLLASTSTVERITLGGLPAVDVGRLAHATGGTEPSPGNVDWIVAQTGGNPLFVKEYVRLLAAQGRLDDDAGQSAVPMPRGVRDVLDRRLARLSAECHELLGLASLIGVEFVLAVLTRASGQPVDDVLDHLGEAMDAGVITEIRPGAGRFQFSHPLFKEALTSSVGPARRSQWHAVIGRAIEAAFAGDLDRHTAALATHFVRAGPYGDPQKAYAYSCAAADAAARVLGYREAAEHLTVALEFVPATDQVRRGELLYRIGEAYWNAGTLHDARAAFAGAAHAARVTADHTLLARAALGFAFGCGIGPDQMPGQVPDPETVALLREALAAVSVDDLALRSQLLARLARELALGDDQDAAEVLALEAVDMARASGDRRARAAALFSASYAITGVDRQAERLAVAEELLALGDASDDPEVQYWGHYFHTRALGEIGQVTADDIDATNALARQLRSPVYMVPTMVQNAIDRWCRGKVDDAKALIVSAKAQSTRMGGQFVVAADVVDIVIRFGEGTLLELEPLFDIAKTTTPHLAAFAHSIMAFAHAFAGHQRQARAELDAFMAVAGRTRLNLDSFPQFMSATLASVWLDDATYAGRIHEVLLPYADRGIGMSAVLGSVVGVLGCLDRLLGRYDSADERFAAAIERERSRGLTPGVMWERFEWAVALLCRDGPGDRSRARSMAVGARRDAEQYGYRMLVRWGDVVLARIDGSHSHARLERDGAIWRATYAGVTATIKDAKGVRDLAVLLATPGREVSAVDLAGRDPNASAGDVLDAKARAEYRARIEELDDDLAEATRNADDERASRAREERDLLVEQLATAVGLGGRVRQIDSSAERARKAVTFRIRQSIAAIEREHRELGRHLDRSVRTGAFCVYDPSST
jgi:hypothetical protein